MTACTNFLLKEQYLVLEIILLAKELSYATIAVFKWADWGALHMHPANVEPMLLKRLLQALWLACIGRHFLGFPAALNGRIVYGNHCVLHLSHFPPIGFVYIECMKCILPE